MADLDREQQVTRVVPRQRSRQTLADVAREVQGEHAGQPVERVLEQLTARLEQAGLRPPEALARRYAVSISDSSPRPRTG